MQTLGVVRTSNVVSAAIRMLARVDQIECGVSLANAGSIRQAAATGEVVLSLTNLLREICQRAKSSRISIFFKKL